MFLGFSGFSTSIQFNPFTTINPHNSIRIWKKSRRSRNKIQFVSISRHSRKFLDLSLIHSSLLTIPNLRFWAQNWTLAKPENSIFGLPEAWFLLPVPPPPTPRLSFSSETVLECLTLRFAVIGAWRWCWLPFAPPLSGFRCRRLLAVRQIPKPSVRRVSNSLIFL